MKIDKLEKSDRFGLIVILSVFLKNIIEDGDFIEKYATSI